MKINKQMFILLAILSIVVFAALFLMSQSIIIQSNEIIALRERVYFLEIIIHKKSIEIDRAFLNFEY